jgi:hypothetical protein
MGMAVGGQRPRSPSLAPSSERPPGQWLGNPFPQLRLQRRRPALRWRSARRTDSRCRRSGPEGPGRGNAKQPDGWKGREGEEARAGPGGLRERAPHTPQPRTAPQPHWRARLSARGRASSRSPAPPRRYRPRLPGNLSRLPSPLPRSPSPPAARSPSLPQLHCAAPPPAGEPGPSAGPAVELAQAWEQRVPEPWAPAPRTLICFSQECYSPAPTCVIFAVTVPLHPHSAPCCPGLAGPLLGSVSTELSNPLIQPRLQCTGPSALWGIRKSMCSPGRQLLNKSPLPRRTDLTPKTRPPPKTGASPGKLKGWPLSCPLSVWGPLGRHPDINTSLMGCLGMAEGTIRRQGLSELPSSVSMAHPLALEHTGDKGDPKFVSVRPMAPCLSCRTEPTLRA